MISIKFKGEKQRIKGIAAMFRSNYKWTGEELNLFHVPNKMLEYLNERGIRFEIK